MLDEAAAPSSDAGDPAAAPVSETAPDERPAVDVALTLTEFGIDADVEEIPAWATVTFAVRNDGDIPHDAAVGATGTELIDAGGSDSFTVDRAGIGKPAGHLHRARPRGRRHGL